MGGTIMKLKKKAKKGFTLIELLIVVAIIAILAAIAIPQFAKYRVRGYNSAADSDLRNLKIAVEAFATDNQVYASTAGCTSLTSTCTGGTPGTGTLLAGPLSYTITVTSGTIMSTPANLPAATSICCLVFQTTCFVITTNGTSGSEGSVYAAVTANTSGDTIYAADSGATSLMRAGKDSAGVPTTIAAGTAGGVLTYVPTTAVGDVASDLDTNFVAM
jgi:prepilin-type N-terminal cleavage/methylation domain-containing protein